ncbi:MAG: DUF4231 domain-containing protein [Cytophagales bacterium]|nr:DUF4231 domain-containing protein [Cytophagales bacterium]
MATDTNLATHQTDPTVGSSPESTNASSGANPAGRRESPVNRTRPANFSTGAEAYRDMAKQGSRGTERRSDSQSSDDNYPRRNEQDLIEENGQRHRKTPLTAKRFLEKKLKDYKRRSMGFVGLYYFVRICGGICAGSLPFFVAKPEVSYLALYASGGLVFFTILDFVFNPKENWRLYSTVSDELEIAIISSNDPQGYQKHKSVFRSLKETKEGRMALLAEIDTIINKNKRAEQNPGS